MGVSLMKCKQLAALALVLCLGLSLAACNLKPAAPWPETLKPGKRVQGNGRMSSDTDINEFMRGQEWTLRVEVARFTPGVCKIVVDESLDFAGKLETDSNIKAGLIHEYNLQKSEIVLRGEPNQWYAPTVLNFTVGVPVNKIILNGALSIDYNCPSVTDCVIEINGASEGKFTFGALDTLRVDVNGTGSVTLAGAAKLADLTINGAANIKGFDLIAEAASAFINGAGNCEITATETLDAEINGLGKVVYGGEPAVSKRIQGLGEVRAK